MIKFAVDGISSFSHFPLQVATFLGFAATLIAFLGAAAGRRGALHGHLRARRALAAVRRAAAGRPAADGARADRRVHRAHLRRGQAPAALRRARAATWSAPRPSRSRARAVRVAVIGAGLCGLVAARRLALAGHASTSTSAGRARRPGGDARRRRRAAARALLPPPVHERPPHRRALRRARDARRARVAALVDGVLRRGPPWPFTTPLDLLRFRPLSLRSRLRMGLAVLRLQRGGDDVGPFEAITARDWITRRDGARGLGDGLGAAAARRSSATAPTTSRWRGCGASSRCAGRLEGAEAREELLGYPRRLVGGAVRGAARRRSRRGAAAC